MSNITWYFHTVQKYRGDLSKINDKYDGQIDGKKSYAGSVGYTADIEKIERERAAEIAALRDECRDAFDRCLQSMQKSAQSRPAVAPTDEQMRLIQLLKLKEGVTRDDLEHAAHSMGDCGLALSILEEIARSHDIVGFHAGGAAVSDQFVKDAIRAFAESARVTLSLDRTDQRRQLMDTGGMGGGQFGTIPGAENIKKFRLDVDPESAQDCAARWGGVPGDVFEAFETAVG